MKSISILLLLIFSSVKSEDSDKVINDEGKLFRKLVDPTDHEPNVRPKHNESVQISFGLNLISLYGIDEEKQTIEIQAWLQKSWTDERLKWNPDEFSGLQHIRIPHDKIWKPDIVLFNGAFDAGENSGFGHLYDAMALVYSTGLVLWIPPARIKGICMLDISNFPFDTQDCHLKFGSWTYKETEVDIQLAEGKKDVDLSYHTESNNWKLLKTSAKRNNKTYACCPDDVYPDITFHFKLQRRRSYYSYMLVLPAIIMALLVPLMFLMPIGRAEKFYLGCTLMICLTLNTLLLEMMVPTAHSGVPFIEAYYLGNFVITGISLALSAAILNISRLRSRPPDFVKKIVGMCAKCCCVDVSGANYRNYKVAMHSAGHDENPIVMDVDGAGGGAPGGTSEWVVIATVLDRVFLFLSIVVAVLVTIGMASHT